MSDLAIRPAGAHDVSGVLAVWRAAESRPTVTDTPEHVRALIERGDDQLLVAELDGRTVGTLIAGFDGWRGNLYRMAVTPDARRRGIGRALVREAEARLIAKGAVRIHAAVVGDDERATAFWAGIGYEVHPELARYTKQAQS